MIKRQFLIPVLTFWVIVIVANLYLFDISNLFVEHEKVKQELHALPETTPSDQSNNEPAPNLLEQYETVAIQDEARRHDRLIVESIASFGSLNAGDIAQMNEIGERFSASVVCITIFTSNRKLHYVDTLLMMLFKGQELERLLSFAQLNLLNTEHRPEKAEFPHMKNLARFEFLNIYNASEMHPLGPDTGFDVHRRRDTINALDICIESKLPYCLLLEDDAVATYSFIDNLVEFVIAPLEKNDIKPAFLTLYSYHSHPSSKNRIDANDYIESGQYESERSKMDRERRSLGLPLYNPNFAVVETAIDFGTVANLYPLDSVKKLRDYLESFGLDDKVNPTDVLIGNFVDMVGIPKLMIQPSMVNHIGFYSERRDDVYYMHTDVRFVVDPRF
mmetsp:Transcript_3280/g.6661  ORF Transcript_3280/g.6661 Transcript_3280/m.6661 type:complete len:389 (+) Transcript_3280:137-1303(+)